MSLKLSQCPCSWGVEEARAPHNPPWSSFLDEVATAGYQGVELGPVGYLPTDPHVLGSALAGRGLGLSAGYVMEPLADLAALQHTLGRARETAAILSALGARALVLIDALNADRSATAGNDTDARRLDTRGFNALVAAVRGVADIATEFGLTVVFHPHVGTHVEFRDEIDRLMAALDSGAVRLCIDSGHAVYAGTDPIQLLRDYSARVGYLHLKDVDPAVHAEAARLGLRFEEAVDRGIFCPVGGGVVDFPGLFAELQDVNYKGWIAVEQDRAAPDNGTGRALADARESLACIRAIEGTTRPRAAEELR